MSRIVETSSVTLSRMEDNVLNIMCDTSSGSRQGVSPRHGTVGFNEFVVYSKLSCVSSSPLLNH